MDNNKKIIQLVINYLCKNNLLTPFDMGNFPHIEYLPPTINDYYFYFWKNTTTDNIKFSINTPKLTDLIRNFGKKLNINVSTALAEEIIKQLQSVIQPSLQNTIKIIIKEDQKNNELNYFKHWISRCMLQYWELKYINSEYKGRNHLLIYDKKSEKLITDEINSKNPKLPFGSFNYNDEYLEKKVFCLTEDNMGFLLHQLEKNDKYELSVRDNVTICYFWLVLILRNKNTIINFSQSLREEIKDLHDHYGNFNEFAISYYRHDVSGNSDKYINEMKCFKNLKELNNFLDSESFYFFAKNVYWKYISPLFLVNSDIYSPTYIKGESVIKDIIYCIMKNYSIKRILIEEPTINLGDYPCLAFKVNNNEIIPINFDSLFFEDYFFNHNIDISKKLKELIAELNSDLKINSEEKFEIYTQIFDIEKIMGFDFLLIPLNPKNLFVVVKKDIESNLDDLVMNFFAKHKLSIAQQEELKNRPEVVKVLYFYSALTHVSSKEFIIFSSPEHLENTNEFIIQENKFISNVTKLIMDNKISYRKNESYSLKESGYLYVQTTLCSYRIK